MRKRASGGTLWALALSLFFGAGNVNAQPTKKIPPVAIGAQTLSGVGVTPTFHEFLTQPAPFEWKGNIGGIGVGDAYWIYAMGIDATGITGPAGRQIRFNLQDSETGSSFKHLGISVSLENLLAGGGDLLECYQSNNDGLSTHVLEPGQLTLSNFDLRFLFTKQASQEGWTITPYYRLSGGEWIVFFDSTFVSSNAFDFLGAKLVVVFDNPVGGAAGGDVSFDNFFVVGPIQGPITDVYVDDDWTSLETGDAVQFPGQDEIQIIGTNAFAAIDDAIAIYRPISALRFSPGLQLSGQQQIEPPTVHVAAGTYTENVLVDVNLHIQGAGSGTDDQSNTIIIADETGLPTLLINGFNVSGLQGAPIIFKDFRVTGASGGTESGGIIITDGFSNLGAEKAGREQLGTSAANSLTITQFLKFENIAAVGNGSSGIGFNHADMVNNIEVIDCDLSNNSMYGLYIPSMIATFDGLTMTNCQVNDNGVNGLTTGPNGSSGVNDINIDGSSFSGNGDALSPYGMTSGDLSFLMFNGDASVTNVTISGDGGQVGLQLSGSLDNGEGSSPSGTVVLDNVTITGTYQDPYGGAGSGLRIANYSDVSGISFNNVQIDVVPSPEIPDGAVRNDATVRKLRLTQNNIAQPVPAVINLDLDSVYGNLNVSNTVLGGNALIDISNFSPGTVDATSATFNNAADNFEIEDRVFHAMDLEFTGLVTWVPSNLFMTKNSFAGSDTSASIRRAINVASSADTLNISQGAYFDSVGVQIDIDLVILGSGKATTTFHATSSTGFSASDDFWFRIDSLLAVQMRGLTLDGAGNAIYYAIRANGGGTLQEICFRDIAFSAKVSGGGVGIYAGGDSPLNVLNCTFEQMGRGGAEYYGVGVAGSAFRDNIYTGKGVGNFIDVAVEVDA
ncbi:hypothetical protein IIA29_12195, partial [candidate division KSB1 bacterium]|nr:hypothetical protein [candidate division KSB1 bacterium]